MHQGDALAAVVCAEALEDGASALLRAFRYPILERARLIVGHNASVHRAGNGTAGTDLNLTPLAFESCFTRFHELGDQGRPGSGIFLWPGRRK